MFDARRGAAATKSRRIHRHARRLVAVDQAELAQREAQDVLAHRVLSQPLLGRHGPTREAELRLELRPRLQVALAARRARAALYIYCARGYEVLGAT